MNTPKKALIQLAKQQPEVEVIWLYGSYAKGNAGPASDIDLAIAFNLVKLENELETRLPPEILADDWCRVLTLPEGTVSIVDINLVPIPLGVEIINANQMLWSRDDGSRRLREEGRIMSTMEIDIEYYAKASNSADILSMRSAMTQNQARINELDGILKQRPLSGLEYLAAERTQ